MSRRSSQAAVLRRGASVFAALSDETRLGIVLRMSRSGPASITTLTEGSGVTRQAVAKHLRVLEGAGLANSTRAGRETSWELLQGGVDDARASLDAISAQWDIALAKLRAHVEQTPQG